jgi:hypothetical protein
MQLAVLARPDEKRGAQMATTPLHVRHCGKGKMMRREPQDG